MTWEPETEELRRRQALAAQLGGEERISKHHNDGKLTVRERIDALCDPGTFREVGSISGFSTYTDEDQVDEFTPANFVFGRAQLDGRPVVVGGDDFTIRGGAADAAIWKKLTYSEGLARELKIPIVRLVDGSGGGGSVKTYLDWGRTYVPPLPGWRDQMEMLSEIPVVAAALGSVAGLGAARVAGSHFSVMVAETSQVFTAGPPLVTYAAHEELTKEELGGSVMQTANGTVDNLALTEDDAFAQIRRFLSYLPRNVWELPSPRMSHDDPKRRDEALLSIIPRDRKEPYDIRAILQMVFDRDSLFEIGSGWGRGMVAMLAELDGYPVGVIASDSALLGGVMTAHGAEKLKRFVDLCDTFHLPLVNMVDMPGFEIGLRAEQAATIRRGVEAIAALYQLTVPYVSVVLRRVFGVAGAALVDQGRNVNVRFAWPSGDWGSLPLEGGIEAAYRRKLAASDNPDALRAQILSEFDSVRTPFKTAEAFDMEEIIDPRDTRPILVDWVRTVYPTLVAGTKGRGFRP